MSKKKKVVLAARLDSLLQQTCMALFLNIFIVTSNSPVSIYIGLFVAAATVFPDCYRGTTCGKADHPWQPYLVRGDHLRQHNLPQMVRGDQLWRGTNCGVTEPLRIHSVRKAFFIALNSSNRTPCTKVKWISLAA